MNMFLVLVLLAIAIVIVGFWLLRPRKADTTTPESVSSQAADVNPPTAELPGLPEVVLAPPNVPQTLLPTSPDAPIPATTETSSDEDAIITAESEEARSTPFPQQPVSSSTEDGFELPDASPRQPPVAESRVPASLPDAHTPASAPATESSVTNEAFVESGSPTEAATADTSAATPLPYLEVEPDAREKTKQSLPETELTPKPPTYHPPTPPAPRRRTSDARERTARVLQKADADLRLRVQVVLGRGGTVKTLALVPDRREGMPGEVEVTGKHGEMRLVEYSNDYYSPVPLSDVANALRRGVEWRGCGDARRWRWVLGGRELYVFAPGDEFKLHGFVSTARLRLNDRHMILATAALCDQVLAALADAGCASPDVNDDNTPGVPSGWILFRNVTPTHAVPMREETDILNALCPAHEIEPHFVGGIKLERNTWLVGFPPRIRFTGELGDDFRVMIDGEPARPVTDGAFEARGWDAEGEHRLWFAGQVATYSLRTMEEGWERWNAHDFRTGAAICGAGIHQIDGTRWHQARVPATNRLLIGSRPGEVLKCQTQHNVRYEFIIALVPFVPVWALPIDSIHADKCAARLVLLNSMEPASTAKHGSRDWNADRALREWVAAINDAGRKQLALADASDDARALWRRYRNVAKRLWKRMR